MGLWCIWALVAGAHEIAWDVPCSHEENRAWLTEIQKAAANCTTMVLTIESCDTWEVTTITLTDEETQTVRQLIMRMQPCTTNLDVDLEMAEWVHLKLSETVYFEADDVMLYGDTEEDGSYLLGHFTLNAEDYALWRRTIAQIRQRQ